MAEDVYRRLQKHFDEFPYQRFPATESGVEISLLKGYSLLRKQK